MYQETSADLVARADIRPSASVIDVCCGTGVTTDAILSRLGPSGSVVAVDRSAAMLEVGKLRTADPRVRWECAAAEEFACSLAGSVDAIVCNSAMWQIDLKRLLREAWRALRPGGRFAFNVGQHFVQVPLPRSERGPDRTPSLVDYMNAIALLDHGIAPPIGAPRRLLRPQALDAELLAAGFKAIERELLEYAWPAAQERAWFDIPAFAHRVPGRSEGERRAILDAAYARLETRGAPTARWLVYVAERVT